MRSRLCRRPRSMRRLALAEHLSDFRRGRQISPASDEVLYALFNASRIGGKPRRTVSRTHSRRTTPPYQLQPKIRMPPILSSHVVSCGSAICPIVPSAASVAMKLCFGAKPGRFFMRSTIWITANHKRECGVFVVAANKSSQASGAKSIEAGAASEPFAHLPVQPWL